MASWLDGRESEWTPGVGDGQEAWRAAIHGVARSQTRLSDWTELNYNFNWKKQRPIKFRIMCGSPLDSDLNKPTGKQKMMRWRGRSARWARGAEESLSYDSGVSLWVFLKSLSLKTTFLKIYRWNQMTAAAAKSLQSCPILCDPIDGSPPGSPIPGILQARTLEWVAIAFCNAWNWKVKVKALSRVRLFMTPWTAAHQAPPSMGFARQEYWSGLPVWLPYIIFWNLFPNDPLAEGRGQQGSKWEVLASEPGTVEAERWGQGCMVWFFSLVHVWD